MERTSLNYGGPVSRGILAWPAQHTSAKWTSVVICLPPVSHNGLSARDPWASRAADQQETKLRFTELLEEPCVATSSEKDLEDILRLLAYSLVAGMPSGACGEC